MHERFAIIATVADGPQKIFPVKLDADEKKAWQEAAKADGVDQLATWIKQVVRAHVKKQKAKEAPSPLTKGKQDEETR